MTCLRTKKKQIAAPEFKVSSGDATSWAHVLVLAATKKKTSLHIVHYNFISQFYHIVPTLIFLCQLLPPLLFLSFYQVTHIFVGLLKLSKNQGIN